jgi:hypothetical protein
MKECRIFATIIIICLMFSSVFHCTYLMAKKSNIVDIKYLKKNHLNDKYEGKVLLLFFNPSTTTHKATLFYSQVLKQKHNKEGFEVIRVSKTGKEKVWLKEFCERSEINFPVVLDSQNELHQMYNVSNCCSATVFLANNKVKYRFDNILSPGNLRQLVEKEIIGKINYQMEPIPQNVFFVGQTSPNIDLFTLGTKNKSDLYQLRQSTESDHLIVTFFSSLCGFCKTGKRVATLIALNEQLKSQNKKYKFAMVFMAPLDLDDVLEMRKAFDIPFEQYNSRYLFTDKEKYLTESSIKKDPFTVILNKSNKIIYIEEDDINEREFSNRLSKIINEDK